MELLATLALSIGPAIAKSLLKDWLKDAGPLAEAASSLVDLAEKRLGGAVSDRATARRIQEIGRRVAEHWREFFDHEARSLDEGARAAVALEVATTLAEADVTADLLVACNLEPERLARHLAQSRPRSMATLSADEASLYELMLAGVSREIVAIAAELSGFQRSAFAATFEGQDRILAMLQELRARPDAESAAFERRYREVVEQQLDRLELFGIPRLEAVTRRQSLTLAYVALGVELSSVAGLPDRSPQERRPATPATETVEGVLAVSRRLVLRGDAGSGKSTLAQWIAVRSAKRDFSPGFAAWDDTIPFFLRLRERVDRDFPAPEDFPGMVARAVAGSMPPGWVHRQLELGRALVLVDGLDEIPAVQRSAVLDRLAELLRVYPLARYVVTSRPSALKVDGWPEWEEWRATEGFIEATLQPMDLPKIELFVDRWHRTLGDVVQEERDDLTALAANLKRLVRARLPLRRLVITPLLCAMVCALHRERGQHLPSERLTLYKECCEMLISRDRGRHIARDPTYPDLGDAQVFSLLQGFAYWLMRNRYTDIDAQRADAHFESRISTLGLRGATGTGIRRYLVERTGVLREEVEGRIDFAHRTLQEYFAAQQAVKEDDLGYLLERAQDDQWRETIILAAGLARPKESLWLVKELTSRRRWGRQDLKRVRILALACLETGAELPQDVRKAIVKQAAEFFPPAELDEARLVAGAGDLAVPLLAPSPGISEKAAAMCVMALAFIGSDQALTAIARFAADGRLEVQHAISSAWDSFNLEEYAERVLARSKKLWLSELVSWDGFKHLALLPSLSVSRILVGDLSPLSHLLGLEELDVWDGDCKQQVIDSLPELAGLTRLSLASGAIVNVNFLTRFPKLEFLALHFLAEEVDLAPIGGLTELKSLDLRSSSVKAIGFIRSLRHLRRIDLSFTGVCDLSPLEVLPNLAAIDISNTPVTDLGVLAALGGLKTLRIDASRAAELPSRDWTGVAVELRASG